ncbi:hypothetical protein LINPERHAP2_LOCUS37618 [Linum perenne]
MFVQLNCIITVFTTSKPQTIMPRLWSILILILLLSTRIVLSLSLISCCTVSAETCLEKKPQSPVLEAKIDKIFRCVKGLSESTEHEDMYSKEEFVDIIDPGNENVAGKTSFSMNNMVTAAERITV